MTWIVIRASGFIAYLLLAMSAMWGLAVSTDLLGRSASKKGLTFMHESLAVGSLLATAIHMLFLYFDEFVDFGPREIFVPGASNWEPLSVAFGVIAFYALFLITVSFYVRKAIGQKAWRFIHFGSFGVFVGAALHGMMAGTDTGTPAGIGIYVGSIVIILALAMVRAITAGQPTSSARHSPRPRPTPREDGASPEETPRVESAISS
ncbi:MAG: ferric reductase-like transmembrane domain-containing protein [Acidimicrobiia bacterium]|nr:ferric reductase-like transmembrane domain-containing protein [Acidimicrobiia bacterium]